jgi:AcrR family transcriptional regulator
MTKEIIYSQERVGREALDLVREKGWFSLSARSIAKRLGSSVGPIYSAFGSMEGLQSYVLDGAARVFDACITGAGTGKSFLDMGIGMALFARDEPLLYRALVEDGVSSGRLDAYKAELLERYRSDDAFAFIALQRRNRIFERMWLFSLGLATALVHGYAEDRTNGGIADLLRGQGAIVIYGEAVGLGDEDGTALRKAWTGLKENGGKES